MSCHQFSQHRCNLEHRARAQGVLPHNLTVQHEQPSSRVASVNMALLYEPATEEAHLAIMAVAEHLRHSSDIGKNLTKKQVASLAAIVRDLLHGQAQVPPLPCFRPLALAKFKASRIGYKPFCTVLAVLEREGLVVVCRGHASSNGGGDGVVTRISPTANFIKLLADEGLGALNVPWDFRRVAGAVIVPEPIRLKGTRPIWKNKAKPRPEAPSLSFDNTEPEVSRLAAEVCFLNNYLAEQDITGCLHEGFYRQFTRGDQASFNWNKGGRLISIGNSYQNMKREDRTFIKINGEETAEIDLTASHLTILHGLLDLPMFDMPDPYEGLGFPRNIAKAWFAMTLGHDKLHEAWTNDICSDSNIMKLCRDQPLETTFPVKKVEAAAPSRFPFLSAWKDSSFRWDEFQYLESCIIISTMMNFVYRDIPSLPVHDSLIIPKFTLFMAVKLFKDIFYKEVGLVPLVKVKSI